MTDFSCEFIDLESAWALLQFWLMQIRMDILHRSVVAVGWLTVLGGCQGIPPVNAPTRLDNAAFMRAWDVYRHCQASTDVEAMRADVKQLVQTASVQEAATGGSGPLPELFNHVIAKPAQRLAADPKAMAAACALSTGQAALQVERVELATEMFQFVLTSHTQPDYAYYVEQARIGLLQVEHAVQFADRLTDIPPALIHISAAPPALQTRTPVSFED